ncbi:S1/P1 nuclease [Flavisolibacter ginsenosidimutans]|uniref:S1/P1 nuclease n=1 Tax=Flavisolibacter ginsenosidimutans TaxID=661481 RepID=A0A5B8UIF0_9BACT|nr:S1/P1 nuclease [Flavisolibacter ginsenosidimutans]QEC55880.1 S1/P1 nuclease [Flavisolibacter ginsenosidimutans]
MKPVNKILLLFFFFALPFYSLAWGVLGHRIVGEIADSYLTAKARAEIKKILGDESIAISANWADFIKSDSTYNYLSPWHYINLERGLSKESAKAFLLKDTAVDLYTKLNFVVKQLKTKSLSLDQKRFYLKLLIHFVGDAHQPLHASGKETAGGNRVRVLWFNNQSNLHAVWDEALVNFQQLSYTEYTAAINHTTLKQRQAWQKNSIADWITESYLVSETLYPEITEKDQKLSYDYNFRHIKSVNEQLLKGGVRLAGLLNAIFG